jgi:hypothetical protein
MFFSFLSSQTFSPDPFVIEHDTVTMKQFVFAQRTTKRGGKRSVYMRGELRWSGVDIHPGDLDNNFLHPTLLHRFFLPGSFSDENAMVFSDLNILWG